MILGRILEVIYQKPYEHILKDKIIFPLETHNYVLFLHYKLIKGLATPYYKDNILDHLIPNIPIYVGNFSAASAMYSTASDLINSIMRCLILSW